MYELGQPIGLIFILAGSLRYGIRDMIVLKSFQLKKEKQELNLRVYCAYVLTTISSKSNIAIVEITNVGHRDAY